MAKTKKKPKSSQSIIANPNLACAGQVKIDWAKNHMPILTTLVARLSIGGFEQPLANTIIVTSVHLEAKTAVLVQSLAKLGATVYATGCNPLSTQDDVAAALAETPGVTVYAKHACHAEYTSYLLKALSHCPHAVIDDGGDLTELLLSAEYSHYGHRLYGICEETTTGISRARALEKKGELGYPVIDINDADCKHNYDNHFGTGQSTLDGILRTTNLVIAGKTVVVAGYGDCGSGIAMRMRGLGAKVIITEVDAIKALRANLDGYTVMPMNQAARLGDIFVTATGCEDVITRRHFNVMKDGALLANAGHFNVEINSEDLAQLSTDHFEARKNITGYRMIDGRTLYLLAEGRLVNLAAGDGHPAEIMDMSFALQLRSVLYLVENHWLLKPKNVYLVPACIDHEVAKLALDVNHIKIDTLTKKQKNYLENGF